MLVTNFLRFLFGRLPKANLRSACLLFRHDVVLLSIFIFFGRGNFPPSELKRKNIVEAFFFAAGNPDRKLPNYGREQNCRSLSGHQYPDRKSQQFAVRRKSKLKIGDDLAAAPDICTH